MTINEYQTAALRTAQTDKLTANELLLNSALGLCGESGEVADLAKKHRFQGHDLDFEHIAKELGDVAWYLAVGAYSIGYDLEAILQMNVDKLKARYPDGFCDYCKGNIIKYIWRWRDNGGVEDLRKASVYLGWLINAAEGKEKKWKL